MYFDYDEDQEQFRRNLREFFERRIPHMGLPRMVSSDRRGGDATLWNAMTTELSLPGLTVPEELGGQGYGIVELCLVMDEAGYALLPGPLFATACLAVEALKRAGGDVGRGLLERIARGSVAALAFDEADGGKFRATATGKDGTYRLSGQKTRVAAGVEAEFIVVTASAPEGPSLFAVESDADGVVRRPLSTFDPTRPMAAVDLSDAEASMVGQPGTGENVLEETLDVARVALAAEQTGGTERCLAIAVGYANERVTFGRPIGSFQAIKHRCADTYVEVEAARSASRFAAVACEEEADPRRAIAVASSMATEAYMGASRTCIQVLGGIGFTAEHPAHLHFRRASASGQWLGGVSARREELAAFALGEQL